TERGSILGLNQRFLIFPADASNLKKDSFGISAEMDQDDPNSATAFIEFWDYSRSLKYDKLVGQINKVNDLFSVNEKTPFYRDFVLPEKNTVEKFKKVYFYTRLYVNGNHLLDKVKSLNEQDIQSLFKAINGKNISE